ncbi:Conserved_hypothetical protein [Hexamita inflata]|uniref:N-acetyltransferase domain-containing protein n=1 Tax=Hexamita inflata TaxID=28002 RepID=A0ABP1HBY0_9EUKA
MLRITPMKLFNKAFDAVQKELPVNANITYKLIEGCKIMHRATHIVDGDRITAFASFIPSYLIKYIDTSDTKKHIKTLNQNISYPLSASSTSQYSESIIVTFIGASKENLKKVLYLPAVQATFKQFPLVIPKVSTVLDLQKLLSNVQLIKDNFVIFPQDLDQLILTEPSKAGPILSKSNVLLHPIIIDTPAELKVCSMIMREAFINDPASCVYQPDVNKRQDFVENLGHMIAKDTLDRGTNYLLCQYNAKNISIQQAGVCALTSPPGSTDRFFGKDINAGITMFKHIGTAVIAVSGILSRVHEQHCGQKDNHGYVAMLGSTVQNTGLGNAVLQIPEDIAEQVNADFYLENSNTKNLKFYTGRGLVLQEQIEVAHEGRSAPYYIMRKDAKRTQ